MSVLAGFCRDCKFWQRIAIVEGGLCMLASWPDPPLLGNDGRPISSKANAIGPNGRGPAALSTAPDFGCVQWRPRD